MMFPSAVEGHMPFIDKYKQEQINKVIRKADRQRWHSGGGSGGGGGGSSADPAAARATIAKETKGRSLPALTHAGSHRPRFISMPEMAASQQPEAQKASSNRGKHSLLSSLKRIFGGKSKAKADERAASVAHPKQPPPGSSSSHDVGGRVDRKGKQHDRVAGFHSRKGQLAAVGAVTATGGSAAAAAAAAAAHSRKRSRARTVSNISTVMETIVEQNESSCSREQLSSSGEDEDESSSSSGGADSSGHGSSGHGGCGRCGGDGGKLPSGDAGDGDSSTEGYDSS